MGSSSGSAASRNGSTSDRRGFLIGSVGLAGLSATALLVPKPAPAFEGDLQKAFAFITKRPELSNDELRARYEAGHVPGAIRVMAPMGLRHYVRNYVKRAVGSAPDFDVISEFGFLPGKTGPNVCGSTIDPNWSRNRSMTVAERSIAGVAGPVTGAPVQKRAILLRQPAFASAEAFAAGLNDFARTTAQQVANSADRIVLYQRSGVEREVHDCVDTAPTCEAILMVWPKRGATLPDALSTPSAVTISSMLDLEAVASVIPA